MRLTWMWVVLAMVLATSAWAQPAVVEWTNPTREACGGPICGDSVCVAWDAMGQCTQKQACPLLDHDDLWAARLYGMPRWGSTWTLVRVKALSQARAGLVDTMAVPTGWCSDHTVTVALCDSVANCSWLPSSQKCPAGYISFYQCLPDSRVDVVPAGPVPPSPASWFRAPYIPPRGVTLYDLSGRKIGIAGETGLYFLQGPGWNRKIVVFK